jgi:putative ABC transport system substrate-binding protein
MPVIGFLYLTSPELARENLDYFRRGLGESGYVEGRNVGIEYRYAHGKNDLLPVLVAELVRRQVSVIVTLESTQGALTASATNSGQPITAAICTRSMHHCNKRRGLG